MTSAILRNPDEQTMRWNSFNLSQKLLASEGGRSTVFAWSRRRPGQCGGKCWLRLVWTWKSVKNKATAGCSLTLVSDSSTGLQMISADQTDGEIHGEIWARMKDVLWGHLGKCSSDSFDSCFWNLNILAPSVEVWKPCRPKALASTWCHHRRLNAVFRCWNNTLQC